MALSWFGTKGLGRGKGRGSGPGGEKKGHENRTENFYYSGLKTILELRRLEALR